MAEGGAGEEVGEEINEKNTGLESRLDLEKEKEKMVLGCPRLSKLRGV